MTPLPASHEARLHDFVRLVLRWNARINLIGPATEPEIWRRHVEDSLQLLPYLPPDADTLVDFGSGAGFPGLVLAIIQPRPVVLVEADRRKAGFLHEAIRVTGATATVLSDRVEGLPSLQAPLITARAFAKLARLLPLAARHLAPGGTVLLPKGAQVEAELTAARSKWHMRLERFPSRTAPDATILRISELHPVDSERPSRQPG